MSKLFICIEAEVYRIKSLVHFVHYPTVVQDQRGKEIFFSRPTVVQDQRGKEIFFSRLADIQERRL